MATSLFLVLAIIMSYRAIKGPTMQDRLLAVNVLGTNAVVILALLSKALETPYLLNMALIYAILNFILAIAVSKFTVEREGVI